MIDEEIEHYGKIKKYLARYWGHAKVRIEGEMAEFFSKGLGHAPVATYPDRPYMQWEFEYEKPRGGNGCESKRDNRETFLEGLQELHRHLGDAARLNFSNPDVRDFPVGEIKDILRKELEKEKRCNEWKKFIKTHFPGMNSEYPGDVWRKEKDDFHLYTPAHIGDCYRFHQAACFHRWYVLKDLLPEHGIYCL